VVGCHIRLGDDIRPDRAMSIELLLEIKKELEHDLVPCSRFESMLTVCLQRTFLIGGFCAGPRGEYIPILSLDAMLKYYSMDQPKDPALRNVFFSLREKVRGEALNEYFHLIPIADETRSVLKHRLWVGIILEVYARLGVRSGWVFRDAKGRRQQPGHSEPYMIALIQLIQAKGTVEERLLTRDAEYVLEVFGIGHSTRRGCATHATSV
jgi:hypothetical protein